MGRPQRTVGIDLAPASGWRAVVLGVREGETPEGVAAAIEAAVKAHAKAAALDESASYATGDKEAAEEGAEGADGAGRVFLAAAAGAEEVRAPPAQRAVRGGAAGKGKG